MLTIPEVSVLSRNATRVLGCGLGLLLLVAGPAFAQAAQPAAAALPKYDLHTETKTAGVVEDVKLLPFGKNKDFTELIVKNGEERVSVYVCPKTFQDELGIAFSKGDQISVTGSKVRQEESEVILSRELVKGSDTFLFRDDKGNPVWDWRTGK